MGKEIPVIDRFWAKVEKIKKGYDTKCWIWIASLNKNGYGWFRGQESKKDGGYKGRLAHRWSYEHFCKKIRDGFELDHLCRNKNCVNPEHLKEVRHADNMRGLIGSLRVTCCPEGHEYKHDTTLIRTRDDGRIYRVCRICKRLKERERYGTNPNRRSKCRSSREAEHYRQC